jgi:hypothetical protein
MLGESQLFADATPAVFVTLAAPHCGARQLRPVLRVGGRILGKVCSTAYQDILLDSEVFDDTCSDENMAPLSKFKHRVLYACARGDHLIGFETASLLAPKHGITNVLQDLPPQVEGYPHVRHALLLEPFSDKADHKGNSRVVVQMDAEGVATPSNITESVCQYANAAPFAGVDDWSGRNERAADMLHRLRSIGQWTLHIVDFPERFISRHCAIIAHPKLLKNPTREGQDVANHLARTLCQRMRDVLHACKV